jgi:hypothetical protein
MHVFPHPKAPGMAQVPPKIDGNIASKHSLASDEWGVSCELFDNDGSRLSDGPLVAHRVLSLDTVEFELQEPSSMNVVLIRRGQPK